MKEVLVEDLDQAMEDVREVLDGEDKAEYESKYEKLREVFSPETVGRCIGKFITAELDHEEPGMTGIGRTTETTPRLGAYFREPLSALPEGSRSELSRLMKNIIVRGYLTQALFNKGTAKETPIRKVEELYEKWIPSIYAPSTRMPIRAWSLLSRVGGKAYSKLKDFLKAHDMKGGGFFSVDKTDDILAHYLLAGFLLRGVEIQDTENVMKMGM